MSCYRQGENTTEKLKIRNRCKCDKVYKITTEKQSSTKLCNTPYLVVRVIVILFNNKAMSCFLMYYDSVMAHNGTVPLTFNLALWQSNTNVWSISQGSEILNDNWKIYRKLRAAPSYLVVSDFVIQHHHVFSFFLFLWPTIQWLNVIEQHH